MKSKTTITAIVAGLLFSLLSAEVSIAAGAEGNVRMSRIERAGAVTSRATAARRVETFKSERTDSWLCAYVSPFFCDYVPTVTSAPQPSAATVQRGRR
jgi:hypothetical protein